MSSLTNIVGFVFEKYLEIYGKISLDKVIKILYLVDWKHTISSGKPLSNIIWKVNDFEPQIDEESLNQIIRIKYSYENQSKPIIKQRRNQTIEHKKSMIIDSSEIETINFVLDWLKDKTETDLRRLVYSTYPAISQNNSAKLDLPNLAKRYEKVKLEII